MSVMQIDDVPRARIEQRVRELNEQRHGIEAQLAAYSAAIGELEALINGDDSSESERTDGNTGNFGDSGTESGGPAVDGE